MLSVFYFRGEDSMKTLYLYQAESVANDLILRKSASSIHVKNDEIKKNKKIFIWILKISSQDISKSGSIIKIACLL